MPSRELRILTLTAGALLALLAGCGPGPGVPHGPADVPGYRATPPDLDGIDPTPLRGRRILLDPGHGGRFPGAIGPGGLTEAEVNLGVALYLQGLLQWAGAEVHLTRTADVDLLAPPDTTLADDLAARVALADSLQPDVFLSLHHNSTASGDPRVNETQTYYPLGREGADRDLARAVHRHLVRLLGIAPARILPGGFHVLRHAPVPAVLGEPAMLSNPVMEGRLSLARSLELEAAAYFLGLREYFAAGSPTWVTDLPDTVVADAGGPPLVWVFEPGDPGAPGLDPATIELRIAGERRVPDQAPGGHRIAVPRGELPPRGEITLLARNLRGRATPLRTHVLRPPPEAVRWRWIADGAGSGGTAGGAGGRGLAVPLATSGPPDHLPPSARPATERPRLLPAPPPAGVVAREALPAGARWLALTTGEPWPDGAVPGGRWQSRHAPPEAVGAFWRPRWPAIPVLAQQPLWLQAPGAHPIWRDATGRDPWGRIAPPDSARWRPLVPALVGQRVVLDPRGGGTREQGRGPLGTRGADLNLQVAGRLAHLLRGLGCEVVLTREGELWTPDSERVRRADAHRADLYLALARGPRPEVRHHPGSRLGTPWAAALAGALTPLVGDTLAARPAADHVLRHTACPAAVAVLEAPATLPAEERLTTAAWQDAEARALLRGTVSVLAPQTPWVAADTLLAALGPAALPAASLEAGQLDGQLTWLPAAGRNSPASLASEVQADPGLPAAGARHLLELRSGPRWQLWALSRSGAGRWHSRLLAEQR